MVRAMIPVLLGLAGLAAAVPSVDGSCGGANNATCLGSEFGNCCSQYGYCGSTVDYCGQGCNIKFGTCGSGNSSTMASSSSAAAATSTMTKETSLPTEQEPVMTPVSVTGARRPTRPVAVRRSL